MRGSTRLAAAIAIAAPCALATGIALMAQASGALSPPGTPSAICAGTAGTATAGNANLTTAQVADARIIYDVATSLNLPPQAAVIAIATSMQESRLLNLPAGTADSLGLFQQRPSLGWGTPAQIMNPVYAATAFYNALVKVPGWQSLPLTVAAQDVQHSQYPGAYAAGSPSPRTLLATSPAAAHPAPPTAAAYPPPGPPGSPADLRSRPALPCPSRSRSAMRSPSSASPTSGAAPARPATTAPAWS